MMKLYIDIDGVLISRGAPAKGVVAFLSFAREHFDCYWLSTHCDGDAKTAFLYLASRLPNEALPLLEGIKPTKWGAMKTDGIDFDSPFYWLDDNLFESERRILESHTALDRFIPIDLRLNPGQLRSIITFLTDAMGQ